MPNDFGKKDNQTLIHVAQVLAQAANANPSYGLNTAATTAIVNDATEVAEASLMYVQAEAALRAMSERKANARAALILKLGTTAKSLEADVDVTDEMLRAAALSARPSKGVKPTSLAAPTGLTADGFSDGTLALKWTRTSKTRVGFVVETSADGAAWDYLATTMRTDLKAPRFAPGQPVYVRVTAVNSTLSSPASNVASVYAPTVPLKVVLGGAETAKAA